jgi:hypothetical protein
MPEEATGTSQLMLQEHPEPESEKNVAEADDLTDADQPQRDYICEEGEV